MLLSGKLRESRHQCGYRVPDVIDDRLHILSRLDYVPFPIREGFVEVKDRFGFVEGDLIKKWNM